MGESDDVINLAFSLRKLEVTSVRSIFYPIPGTPFEGLRELNPPLRVLSLPLPSPCSGNWIAGGREVHQSLQPLGLYPANSIFIGDYLTTPGQAAMST